ncbi:MAG: carbamoyl-phosphate synthase small subunit, partial [Bdellovibrionales bacterium]|nr:carbamoyl-phosphate synthase small subunit [Bdellovibrionales bacterium]
MNKKGFLILESSESYSGRWLGGKDRAGEVVFNTSHCGYEEIATDPSYFSQIMVMTAPMQGNYGSRIEDSESSQPHIQGFIALEIQNTKDNSSWKTRLENSGIPLLDSIDTRKLVLRLRESGTPWGALIQAENLDEARGKAKGLIDKLKAEDSDWVWAVSRKSPEEFKGNTANGPRVALLDYGAKQNIIRELQKTCSAVKVFPSRATAKEIQAWEPNGIMLSNGPGDPDNVKVAVQTIKDLLG